MEPLKRMRLMAVKLSLFVTAAAAAVAYFFDAVIAHGILLGGLAGILAFWILAVRVEKLAVAPANKVRYLSFQWSLFRMLIYVLALGRAYYLDRESMRGLLAAAAGLFIVRLVVVFLAVTGLDLNREEK